MGYFKYRSFNEVSEKWVSQVELPALTICNLNVVNYTRWKIDVQAADAEAILDTFVKELNAALKTGNDMDPARVIKYEEALAETKKDDWLQSTWQDKFIMRDYGSDFEAFYVGDNNKYPQMEFANQWLTVEEVGGDYLTTELGKCLVLNDNRFFVQRMGGSEGGFTIDLDTKTDSYLNYAKLTGFMVFLRNPGETVLKSKDGIYIPPGQEVFLRLNKKSISRLPPNYGTCKDVQSQFNRTVKETVRECNQRNEFDHSISRCKCVPWYLAHYLSTVFHTNNSSDHEEEDNQMMWRKINFIFGELYPEIEFKFNDSLDVAIHQVEDETCSFFRQMECDLKIFRIITDMKTWGEEQSCPEPCRYLTWDYIANVGPFPGTSYYFTNHIKDAVTYTDLDDARANLIRLHVYYDEIKVTEIEQEKAYEWYNFLAEFGGATDLFVGLSFFTVFQLIEIGFGICVYKCFGSKKDSA